MGYILVHALALVAISAATCVPGVLWDRLLLWRLDLGPLRAVAFAALAVATWVAIGFGLSALQLLRPGAVLVLLGVLSLCAVWAWRRHPPEPQTSENQFPWTWLTVAVPIAALFVAFFLLALMPRMAQDTEAYHLAVPRIFVDHGGFRRIPFNIYSNWPLATEILYSLVLLFGDFVSATLVHFAFGVLITVALVLGTTVAIGSRWAGWFAAAFFWMNNVVQTEISAAYVELAFTFFFVAAFLFVHRAVEDHAQRSRLLFIAGVSAGMVASIKLNGAIGASCIAMLCLYRRLPARQWVRSFVVPAVLIALVWPIKSWILTGNPIYPFGRGGPEWSTTVGAQFAAWQRSIGMGRGVLDYLLLPLRVLLDGGPGYEHFDGVISPVWIALVPLTVVLGWRPRFVRECLGVSVLYFVLWAMSSQQVRFLLPCLALLSLAAGVAVAEGATRYVKAPERMAFPALGVAASGLLLFSSASMFRDARDWLAIYRKNGSNLPGEAIPAMFGFIDRSLPPGARILLLRTNRGFFVHREYIADSFFEASQIADWLGAEAQADEVFEKLRKAGVTHILLQDWGSTVPYPPGLLAIVRGHRGTRVLFHDEHSNQWLFSLCDALDCR